MSPVTDPLRAEHRELLPHVEQLLAAADAAQANNIEIAAIEAACAFLTGHLLPHAKAEEAALYPVVARVMGSQDATRTMERDHQEVKALTDDLLALRSRLSGSTPDPAQLNDLRRLLYGLYALIKVHFAKEEEVYLPLLDRQLSPDEGRQMFEVMEKAAALAKSA